VHRTPLSILPTPFYEKVVKVKADVAALLIFFDIAANSQVAWRGVKSARFLAFILTLDSSPRHFIFERYTAK